MKLLQQCSLSDVTETILQYYFQSVECLISNIAQDFATELSIIVANRPF